MHDGQQRLRALGAPRLLLQMLGWKVEMAACYHTGGGGRGLGRGPAVRPGEEAAYVFFFLFRWISQVR